MKRRSKKMKTLVEEGIRRKLNVIDPHNRDKWRGHENWTTSNDREQRHITQ